MVVSAVLTDRLLLYIPLCLLGTMITCLLLLLSLGSVDGVRIHLKDFTDMVKETTSKEISDALPNNCNCAKTTNDQLLGHIRTCCDIRQCCYNDNRICHTGYQKYSYTYSNGTITCDRNRYIGECATQTCECDWKAAICLMDTKNSEENSKYRQNCYRKINPCSDDDDDDESYLTKLSVIKSFFSSQFS
ncbi:acidic phospholipase A2 homolog [Phyllobates terribilis]|uniref:acidic phospholipase A2 homolog n=1 Tax=Phyllobates terribilis TaxID=111132 RepID=UPI003CCA913A